MRAPAEHPILNNVVLCILTILIGLPIVILAVNAYMTHKDEITAAKTEETIAYIESCDVVTDYNGDTRYFEMSLEYNIDGKDYSKKIQMDKYYKPGQYVKIYYELGNPYGASPVKVKYRLSVADKMKFFSSGCIIAIIFFIFKSYSDVCDSRDRRRQMAYNLKMQKSNNIWGNNNNIH